MNGKSFFVNCKESPYSNSHRSTIKQELLTAHALDLNERLRYNFAGEASVVVESTVNKSIISTNRSKDGGRKCVL